MELKSRLAAILNEIVENDSGVSIDGLLSKYSITKRTLYYDLEVINSWLKKSEFGETRISNQLLYLISNRKGEILVELENSDYYYSIEERRIIEFLYITLSHEPVNINTFQKLFGVSKNTVANDIRELKEILDLDKINLLSTAKQGYFIQGEEYAIRKKIGIKFNRLVSLQPKEEIKSFIQETLMVLTRKNFDYFEIARCLIKQYEIDIESQLYTGYIEAESAMILVAWIRTLKGNVFSVSAEERDTLKITRSYLSMVKNSSKLRAHGLYIPDNEVFYMTTLLLGIRTAQFSSQEQETVFIYDFVNQLIKNYETIACLEIADKDQLAIRLRSHIRPFYYRLKYGLQETNSLTSQVKDMYPEAFSFCKRAIKEIDNIISSLISDDEIAYLTIYFVGTQSDSQIFRADFVQKHRILVISHKGRAESDHLIIQLRDLLGESFEFVATQYKNDDSSKMEGYSLIVSTVMFENIDEHLKKKVVYVPNVLSDEYARIIKVLSNQGVSNKDNSFIERLIRDVKAAMPNVVFDSDKLYLDFLKSLQMANNNQLPINFDNPMEIIVNEGRYRRIQGDTTWESILFEGYRSIYGQDEAFSLLSKTNILEDQTEHLYNILPNVIIVHCVGKAVDGNMRVSVVSSRHEVSVTKIHRGNIFIFCATDSNAQHFQELKEIHDYCDDLSNKDIESIIN